MTRSLPLVREDRQIGPDWVRISYASAIALRCKSGRFTRELPSHRRRQDA